MSGASIVADTSVLQYLFQLGALDLLPKLFGEVLVPAGVARELAVGRECGWEVPDPADYRWMHVSEVDAGARPRAAAKLGEGEQDCLALALQMADALLLVDDEGARQCARTLGIAFTGTLGVLLRAKEQSLLPSVSPLLDRLQSLGFRVRPTVRAHVLRLAGE